MAVPCDRNKTDPVFMGVFSTDPHISTADLFRAIEIAVRDVQNVNPNLRRFIIFIRNFISRKNEMRDGSPAEA